MTTIRRFPVFSEFSQFLLRFLDFEGHFRISMKISDFVVDLGCISAIFKGISGFKVTDGGKNYVIFLASKCFQYYWQKTHRKKFKKFHINGSLSNRTDKRFRSKFLQY